MGFFQVRRHASSGGADQVPSGSRTQPRSSRSGTGTLAPVPPGFVPVAEALVHEESPLAACAAVGRELARDGASLEEVMAGLRETWQSVRGEDPDYAAAAEMLRSWSETTLAFVHEISCEDPLTGLASLAHLRSSIGALFRGYGQGEGDPQETHALVVVDLPHDRHGSGRSQPDVLTRTLRVARLGEAVRTVFPGSAVISRVSSNRVAVLAPRERRLGVRVRLLRRLLDGMDLDGQSSRVWIEGIPTTDTGAGLLLDELARP